MAGKWLSDHSDQLEMRFRKKHVRGDDPTVSVRSVDDEQPYIEGKMIRLSMCCIEKIVLIH